MATVPSMRAARCLAYGPPESVVVEEIPDPVPKADEVLIRIESAALNYPDVLIVANQYQISIPPPFTPGSELAGVVEAVGRDVTDLQPGDRSTPPPSSARSREYACLPARAVTIPDGVTSAEAAAFGVVYATAYHANRRGRGRGRRLGRRARRRRWRRPRVRRARPAPRRPSARGGVVTREARGLPRPGAEEVIDYETEDLKERIKEITGGGADVVLDPVGGPYAEQALRATRWGGRFVTLGFASGEIPRIPLNLVLLKGVIVKGFEIRTFGEHAPAESKRDDEELDALFDSGTPAARVGDVLARPGERRARRAGRTTRGRQDRHRSVDGMSGP